MERIAAKVKVATLVANYVKIPRGRGLRVGAVDRVTDRVLADEKATAGLVNLDPNNVRDAHYYVLRHHKCFKGAG